MALALDRRDRRSRAPRGSLRPRDARRLLPRAGLVGRLGGNRIRGGEAPARPRHDGDGLSRVRARAARRPALVRAGGRRRRDDRAGPRVLADSRRGAARLSARDARSLVDRPRVRRPVVGPRRPGGARVHRGDADPNAALDPLRLVRARPALALLAVGTVASLALVVHGLGLGRARRARSRRRGRRVRAPGSPLAELARHDRRVSRARSSSMRPGRRALSRSASESFRSSPVSRHLHVREARRPIRRRARSSSRASSRSSCSSPYAGIKGAQISITFSTLVVERNLIYLCPILFAATALAFVRGVGRGWAIAGATVFTVYVVTEVPLQLDNYPYYEAHGLSLPAFLNREWGWPEGRIESTLLVACFVSVGHPRRAPVSPSRLARLHRSRGDCGRRGLRLDAHGRGLRGRGRAPARQADRRQPAGSLRLGRSRDGRRLGRRPRTADDRRPDGRLPHRVLQPLGQEGVEHGRNRARPRRDPDARPRQAPTGR